MVMKLCQRRVYYDAINASTSVTNSGTCMFTLKQCTMILSTNATIVTTPLQKRATSQDTGTSATAIKLCRTRAYYDARNANLNVTNSGTWMFTTELLMIELSGLHVAGVSTRTFTAKMLMIISEPLTRGWRRDR